MDSGSAAEDAFPVAIEHTFGERPSRSSPNGSSSSGGAQDTVYALGLEPCGGRRPTPSAVATTACCRERRYYDPEVTTPLDTADGPPLEAIAALEPDVILAPYEGFDEAVDQSLTGSRRPWPSRVRRGRGRGASRPASSGRRSAGRRRRSSSSPRPTSRSPRSPPRARVEGPTSAYTSMGAEALDLYLPTDLRVQPIAGLGSTVAPRVGRARRRHRETLYAQLGPESAPEIESDVLVGFADGLSAEEAAALPTYSQVPAIQNDAAVLIDDQSFAAAVSSASVLAIRTCPTSSSTSGRGRAVPRRLTADRRNDEGASPAGRQPSLRGGDRDQAGASPDGICWARYWASPTRSIAPSCASNQSTCFSSSRTISSNTEAVPWSPRSWHPWPRR